MRMGPALKTASVYGKWLILIGCLSLAGCQSLQLTMQRQEDWRLKARTAITTPEESGSATLIWQQNSKESDFHLFGSLGGTLARVHESAKGVSLELGDKRKFQGDSAEQLLSEVLGWPFPWQALHFWVQGRPAGLTGESSQFDEAGHLTHIQWQQWQIAFSRYQDYGAERPLPRIIDVRGQDFRLKIVVKSWKFGG